MQYIEFELFALRILWITHFTLKSNKNPPLASSSKSTRYNELFGQCQCSDWRLKRGAKNLYV